MLVKHGWNPGGCMFYKRDLIPYGPSRSTHYTVTIECNGNSHRYAGGEGINWLNAFYQDLHDGFFDTIQASTYRKS